MNSETNEVECLWPPEKLSQSQLTNLVSKQVEPEDSWSPHKCEVVSCYDTYLNAHLGAKARLDDSNYETEKELGVGKRRKRAVKRISSDEDEENNVIIQKSSKSELKKKAPAKPSAPVVVLRNNAAKVSFLAKKTIKSPIKVVSKTKSSEREVNNNSTLKAVRKDRGSKAKSVSDLKSILQERKQEAEQAKLKTLLVSCTSPNWKASKLQEREESKSKDNDKDSNKNEVTDSDDESKLRRPSKFCSNEKSSKSFSNEESSSPVSILYQTPPKNSPAKSHDECLDSRSKKSPWNSVDEWLRSQSKKSPALKSPRSHVSKKLFELSSQSVTSNPEVYTDFERKVLTLLKEVNEKVEVVSTNQTKLNLHLLPNEKVLSQPSGMPTLPVKTVRDLGLLLQSLKDSQNVSTLSTYLSAFVSKDEENEAKSALKVMTGLLANCIAKHYNFAGNKGKMSFSNTALWTVVKGAVALKLNTNLEETEKTVKKWLKDAPWRTQEDGADPKHRGSGGPSKAD